jgi:TRAP-type C4-dicarboxylate transport system substrate-binding protein
MKNKWAKRKGGYVMKKALFCISMVALVSLFCLQPAIAKEKEFKAVAFLPKNHPYVAMANEWVNRINDACKGELKINFVGGPEVIPGLEQVEALRTGVVQVTFSVTAYYQSRMPEGVAFELSKFTPWECRKPGGFFDFFVKAHKEKVNAMFIGQWLHSPFYIWLKDPVKTPEDLKGRKLRTTALYDRFLKALGAVPVTINVTEVYTALKRGTVEGAGWPLLGLKQFGWTEVIKYLIDHPFYNTNSTILMNLDSWNSLSPSLQKKIMDITIEYEPFMHSYFESAMQSEWKELEKEGVKKIKFSPPDAKRYLDTAYEVEWEALEQKVPDLIPTLRKICGY